VVEDYFEYVELVGNDFARGFVFDNHRMRDFDDVVVVEGNQNYLVDDLDHDHEKVERASVMEIFVAREGIEILNGNHVDDHVGKEGIVVEVAVVVEH
jgi:hypothetical protein